MNFCFTSLFSFTHVLSSVQLLACNDIIIIEKMKCALYRVFNKCGFCMSQYNILSPYIRIINLAVLLETIVQRFNNLPSYLRKPHAAKIN